MSITIDNFKQQNDSVAESPADIAHSTTMYLCCYVNATSQIQVARIANVPQWYFERVVFPGQRLMFEAPLDARLEVHTGQASQAILADTILCDRLRVEA
ncbi:MAG: DUF1830 domain-containing protein [Thainema sp.]